MNPFDGRLWAFDIESTGVELEEARIVTAAVVSVGGGEPTESRTWLADPGVPIPEGAALIHGVTTERAQAEGRPAAEVVAEVLEALRGREPLIAFNARFDLTILDREARRYGLRPLREPVVVDPLVIDKHLDRYRSGSRKLDAICAHYGVALGRAHDADADALAAARLAWVMGKRGGVTRRARDANERAELAILQEEWAEVRASGALLHLAQAGWAREQAEGLAAHFRREGKEDVVPTEWPVVPVPSAGVAHDLFADASAR